MAVGDGAHDGADRQAVEVVVNEDQHAQQKGGEHRARAGVDMLHRPAPKGRGAAGGVDEGHHDAQQHEKDENARVPAVSDGADEAVLDHGVHGGHQVKAAHEERAHQNADKQGGIGLLGDQGQDNGHNGRHKRPEGSVHTHTWYPP